MTLFKGERGLENCRIIVVSDTHGGFHALYEIVQRHLQEAFCFIHLGDGYQEIDEIRELYPAIKLYSVCGNCDFVFSVPGTAELNVAGKRIFYTHGHLYGIKAGLERIIAAAKNIDADIALYGHSHQGYTGYEDGLYIMNPGSPTRPRNSKASYGVIDITKAGIAMHLVEV